MNRRVPSPSFAKTACTSSSAGAGDCTTIGGSLQHRLLHYPAPISFDCTTARGESVAASTVRLDTEKIPGSFRFLATAQRMCQSIWQAIHPSWLVARCLGPKRHYRQTPIFLRSDTGGSTTTETSMARRVVEQDLGAVHLSPSSWLRLGFNGHSQINSNCVIHVLTLSVHCWGRNGSP
jgi:hypothetical protein